MTQQKVESKQIDSEQLALEEAATLRAFLNRIGFQDFAAGRELDLDKIKRWFALVKKAELKIGIDGVVVLDKEKYCHRGTFFPQQIEQAIAESYEQSDLAQERPITDGGIRFPVRVEGTLLLLTEIGEEKLTREYRLSQFEGGLNIGEAINVIIEKWLAKKLIERKDEYKIIIEGKSSLVIKQAEVGDHLICFRLYEGARLDIPIKEFMKSRVIMDAGAELMVRGANGETRQIKAVAGEVMKEVKIEELVKEKIENIAPATQVPETIEAPLEERVQEKKAIVNTNFAELKGTGRFIEIGTGKVEVIKKLGSGASSEGAGEYGGSWLVRLPEGPLAVAKVVGEAAVNKMHNERAVLSSIARELEIMGVKGVKVPKLLGYGPRVTIMELAEGQRADELSRENKLPAEEAVILAMGVANVVAACHRKGISLYDFQPRNYYWDSKNRFVTAIDFDLIRDLNEEDAKDQMIQWANFTVQLITGTRACGKTYQGDLVWTIPMEVLPNIPELIELMKEAVEGRVRSMQEIGERIRLILEQHGDILREYKRPEKIKKSYVLAESSENTHTIIEKFNAWRQLNKEIWIHNDNPVDTPSEVKHLYWDSYNKTQTGSEQERKKARETIEDLANKYPWVKKFDEIRQEEEKLEHWLITIGSLPYLTDYKQEDLDQILEILIAKAAKEDVEKIRKEKESEPKEEENQTEIVVTKEPDAKDFKEVRIPTMNFLQRIFAPKRRKK